MAGAFTRCKHAEMQSHTISRLLRQSPTFNHNQDAIGDVQALGASRFINLTSTILKRSESEPATGHVVKSLLSLEDWVYQLASFKGWDPHDVIFACVSLWQQTQGVGFAVSEPRRSVRKAADKFLGLLRRRVHQNEKPAVLKFAQFSGIKESMGDAALCLIRSVTSDIGSRREIESFLSQVDADRIPYNINYELPVLSTYKEFVAHVLRESRSLGILCRPWAPS